MLLHLVRGQKSILRTSHGWQPFSDVSGDTVAFTDVNGKRFWGVNSGHFEDLNDNSDYLMRKYHERITTNPNRPSILNPKYNQGNSRVFTHAEGNLLAKVYDAYKETTPKTLNIYCDRELCSYACRNYQIEVARGLDINNLIFINSNGRQYLYTTKNNETYYRILLDGTIEKINYTQKKKDALKDKGIQ